MYDTDKNFGLVITPSDPSSLALGLISRMLDLGVDFYFKEGYSLPDLRDTPRFSRNEGYYRSLTFLPAAYGYFTLLTLLEHAFYLKSPQVAHQNDV